METLELQAELRSEPGKGPARRIRRSGRVPAILYGPKRETVMISVDSKEFATKVSTIEGSHLIRFQSVAPDVADRVALVKEVQLDPVSGAVIHADFCEVDLTATLRVAVPLHFVGKAVGVALGGILQPAVREVEVECLPGDIPEFLDVDVSGLAIHESIHVSKLQPPPGVTIVYESDFPLVSVLAPAVEEVRVSGEGAEAAGAGAAEAGKPEA